MEKAVDVEAKVSLQPISRIRKIDSKTPKDYRHIKNNESSWDYRDGDKAKSSYNSPLANASQLQTQTQIQSSKKDKYYLESHQGDHLATKVNISEVVKKGKDKTKDLGHIKYHTYK